MHVSQDIVRKVLAGIEAPAHTLFAKNVPYADIELHPKLAYDPEKVIGWMGGL